jgi:hypothetical protein
MPEKFAAEILQHSPDRSPNREIEEIMDEDINRLDSSSGSKMPGLDFYDNRPDQEGKKPFPGEFRSDDDTAEADDRTELEILRHKRGL